MATKTDYYDRIISSLQSEITTLKTTIESQRKEIEEIRGNLQTISKSNQIPHVSLSSLPKEEVGVLLAKVKEVCDTAIRLNHAYYIEIFATRQELVAPRESSESSFLSSDSFKDYCKSQETRLKSIEERLSHRFSLLTINCRPNNTVSKDKCFFQFDSIKNLLEHINFQWLLSILVFFSICMISVYFISSIAD